MRKEIIGFILFILLGIIVIQVLNISSSKKQVPNSEQDILDDCKNLNLENTSFCLRDNIETFYLYNLSDKVYITPTLERLKERGGDCEDWSVFYTMLGKELEFRTSLEFFSGDPPHQRAKLWDGEDYCALDLLKVSCKIK